MVDLEKGNYLTNAELLFNGFWYAELPDLLDIKELEESIPKIFDEIQNGRVSSFKQNDDKFIQDFSGIVSPPYIRAPGVEAISFFDFKKNKSLREMQIPHIVHYIAFIYNTLFNFESLFEALYLDAYNSRYVSNSNSYLVFEDEFVLRSYDGDEEWISAGVFATTNNKIGVSAALTENKKRLLAAEADYLYSLKMDVESFFPNLYTHNFEKMATKLPFSDMDIDGRYFKFLDIFHQRINNNQTKGIPSGTYSSHVAAELCMLCVDEEIRRYLESRKDSIGYVRYVDDLNFFSDSESELTELYLAVQTILNRYRLRINGNKTEASHTVYTYQTANVAEIEQIFPKLELSDLKQEITISDFFLLKRYIGKCLNDGRLPQIRTLLTIILKRLQNEKISIDEIATEFFYYLLKLVFEDASLTPHVYRLLNFILVNSENKEVLINAMQRKQVKIDAEYPDTVLQIWHYYVLFRHSDTKKQGEMIASIGRKKLNPLIVAAMVVEGKGKNKILFQTIRDEYVNESGSTQWKAEIMYSKWWLPLFKIWRYDTYDYDHFMRSNNFLYLLKTFSLHETV